MSRTALPLFLGACFACLQAGCSHFVETRTITAFTQALESGDLAELKSKSSPTFEHKALRLPEASDDMKILELPEGEVEIVEVEDLSESKKRVVAEVGASKQRLRFHLVKDAESRKWVVDDIYNNQEKVKGLTAARSVTEQMDLLLTVREFVTTWSKGDTEHALDAATPRLHEVLADLPPKYFEKLIRKIGGKRAELNDFDPDAQMDADIAVVRLPRSSGAMVLSMKLIDDRWLVDDLAVESREDGNHIASLLKRATIVNVAAAFLDAYQAGDKEQLAASSHPEFYEKILAHADLDQVEMPGSDALGGDIDVQQHDPLADIVVSGESATIKVSLERVENKDQLEQSVEYLVEDATIYEVDGKQVKRLSALFTAHSIMRVFGEALVTHNLPMLRETSTVDFNRRVWERMDPRSLERMPLSEIENERPEIISTVFNDAIIEITVMQGRRALTYVLRDYEGAVRVDDVLIPVLARPSSLKVTLELAMPISKLAEGLKIGDMSLVQRNSSTEFNRMVWTELDTLPEMARQAPHHLKEVLTTIEQNGAKTVVMFGDDRWGAKVELVKENQDRNYVVDDVMLIAGVEPEKRIRLKESVRQRLLHAGNRKTTVQPRPMDPASYAAETPPPAFVSPAPNSAIRPSNTAFEPPGSHGMRPASVPLQ